MVNSDNPFDSQIDLYLSHLRVERSLSGHTVSAYGHDIEHFFSFLSCSGIENLNRVGRGHIMSYFLDLSSSGKLGPRSRARRLAAIRSFFAFMESEKIIGSNPAYNIEAPKVPRSLPKALSAEDIINLVTSFVPDTVLGLRNRTMFELMYAGGLRVSELLELNLSQINISDSFIRVRGKGSKERLTPIGENAVYYLTEYLEKSRPLLAGAQSGVRLFLNSQGTSLSRQYFWRLISRQARLIGLAKVSPHVLRHSFATHLVEGGANLKAVQVMLGHASLATTEVYLKVEGSRLKKVHHKYHPRALEQD